MTEEVVPYRWCDKLLEFKWSVSKVGDTCGNICSLYVDGKNVFSLGGINNDYDLKAVVLGNWIVKEFTCRLLNLKASPWKHNGLRYHDNQGKRISREPFDEAIPYVAIDCDMSSVKGIIEAMGLKLENLSDKGGRSVYHLIGEG